MYKHYKVTHVNDGFTAILKIKRDLALSHLSVKLLLNELKIVPISELIDGIRVPASEIQILIPNHYTWKELEDTIGDDISKMIQIDSRDEDGVSSFPLTDTARIMLIEELAKPEPVIEEKSEPSEVDKLIKIYSGLDTGEREIVLKQVMKVRAKK